VRHSILAVDDEEMIRDFLAAALESGGYIPIEAASAGEAYAKLEAGASSLAGLITDVNLGRGQASGWDVARRARELNAAIPVVYITGDSAAAWSTQRVPHSVLLQKPFKSADLVAAISGLCPTA